ncbi:MAG TPA: S41 family peptidase [Chloroflexota bacterium]|jgi:carboxyl-terminal processing protease
MSLPFVSQLLALVLGLALTLGAAAPPLLAQTPAPVPQTVPSDGASPGADSALAAGPSAPENRPAAIRREAAVIREAWDLLLDRFVDPLDATALARAAEDAMRDFLAEQGVTAPPDALAASDERGQAWAALAERYRAAAEQGDDVDPALLAHAAIAAMAGVADDTHTHFMSPRQYREHQAWTRGEVKYAGIGARLRGPTLTIVEVFEGSPAARAGLRAGDRILQVGDTSTDDMRVEEAVLLVRGEEGSPVTLQVQRAGSGRTEAVTLTRAEIQVSFVESRMVGDMAYVRLRGFPEPSVIDQVEQAIGSLQAQGARGLIFDLRGNAGGRLDVGARLLSRFVASGPIYQEVDRRGRQATRNVRNGSPILTVPLAVLIDDGTASMGEIFAVNIQEHAVGRLFGTTTMGSVAASQVLPLADGSALQLAVMQIYSGQGQHLNREGVQPDQDVELRLDDLQSGRDPQVEAAAAYLRGLAESAVPISVAAR